MFIDIDKAFVSLSHLLLLKPLKDSMKNGVPQGTVLGPVFFPFYHNNLVNIDSSGEIMGFADDTTILYKADPLHINCIKN